MPPSKFGDIVRYEEPPRPLSAAFVIVALSFIELIFVVAFFWTLVNGWKSPATQIRQSQWLFVIFLLLGFILLVYRRYFMPDILVVKVRNKKYEDFIDPNRTPKVE